MIEIIYNADDTVTMIDGERTETVPNDANLDTALTVFSPAPVPASVSPADFRIALDQLGLLDEVEAYVATLPKAAQIKWQWAVAIERDNALIAAAAQSENWSVEQIDEVFRLAAAASM